MFLYEGDTALNNGWFSEDEIQTIESITFDAYTGAVNCLSVFVCLLLPLLHRLIG